jgi:transposase
VVRFNARGPDGLVDGKARGNQSRLNDAQRQALVEAVERGPIPAIHGVVRWRLIDLVQWLHEEFAVSLDETTVGRELKKLGYVKLTARPRHHAQNEYALEAFKKGALLPSWQRSGQPSQRARP